MSETPELGAPVAPPTIEEMVRVKAYSLSALAVLYKVLIGRPPLKLRLGDSSSRMSSYVQLDPPGGWIYFPTRDQSENKLTAILAPLEAEIAITGAPTASSDSLLEEAREVALAIVKKYEARAIDDEVEAILEPSRARTHPEKLAQVRSSCRESLREQAAAALIADCRNRAKELLSDSQNRAMIESLAEKLIADGELDADTLRELLSAV